MVFEEHEIARSHQFELCWTQAHGDPFRQILRQQWNFSPPGTIREVENYGVQLSNLKKLELVIQPDIAGGHAIA